MQVLIYHLQSINWTYKSIYKCLIKKKLERLYFVIILPPNIPLIGPRKSHILIKIPMVLVLKAHSRVWENFWQL